MKKKISIDELRPGMYVDSTNRSWLRIPFFRRRIRDEKVVEKLREYEVTELIIDTAKGADVTPDPVPVAEHQLLAKEFDEAEKVLSKAVSGTAELMEGIRNGAAYDDQKANDQVHALIDQILEDPSSLLCVNVLRDSDEYTYDHCVNMSILALYMGNSMGLNEEQLFNLGKGALLHDLGKCMIPREILTKPGKLSEQEMAVMRTHVERGVSYLERTKTCPPEVLQLVGEHHERVDGKGYPKGLRGDQISWYGKIGKVMDSYDTMLHKNHYKEPCDPREVLDDMEKKVGQHFDPEAFAQLRKCLGPFPPGTLVMLDSGEMAISFEPNPNAPNRPRVLVVSNADGTMREFPVSVDLADPDASGKGDMGPRTILTSVTLDDISFNPLEVVTRETASLHETNGPLKRFPQ